MKTRKYYQDYASGIVFAALLFLIGFKSYAGVTTYDYELGTKGYSIEKIPGKNEFVVAGTFHVDGLSQPYTGYHFMHLDINGNVLLSNYIFPDPNGANSANWQLRVVDIVVEDADNYWIVMAARDYLNDYDFIYAEKVQLSNGGQPSTLLPNQVAIGNQNESDFQNIYPTHAVYDQNHLYICGYVSGPNPSSPSPTPTVTSLGKKGMMSSTDVSLSGTPTTVLSTWESVAGLQTAPYDYDMALKIHQDGNDFYVTGAGNTDITSGTAPSGAIFAHFNGPNLVFIGGTVNWYNTGVAYPDPTRNGIFGIDIRKQNDGFYLLTNEFLLGALSRWGIARLDPITYAPVPGTASYANRNSTNTDWVKQFMYHPPVANYGNLSIVGEIAVPTYCPSSPFISPSFTNVNPFIVESDVSWTGAGINVNLYSQYLHAANNANSTTSTTLDYLASSPGAAGTCLENVTRLHTFACPYLDGSSDNLGIALIYPKQRPSTNTHLNTKFMTLDVIGHEPVCANEWNCHVPMNLHEMQSISFNVTNPLPTVPEIRDIVRRDVDVDQDYCQNGSFKPSGIIANTIGAGFRISPNPASNELNITLPQVIKADDAYNFVLTDITGREVYRHTNAPGGVQRVHISLPSLTPGIYMGTVNLGTETHKQKVIIK